MSKETRTELSKCCESPKHDLVSSVNGVETEYCSKCMKPFVPKKESREECKCDKPLIENNMCEPYCRICKGAICRVLPPSNTLKEENKKECKQCRDYPDGHYGFCGECSRTIAEFPTTKKKECCEKCIKYCVQNSIYGSICDCHSPTQDSIGEDDWEKEFRKKFVVKNGADFPFVGFRESDSTETEFFNDYVIIDFIRRQISQAQQETILRAVEEVEKLDTFWRHPMALFPKDKTPQSELKEMKIKDSVITILKSLSKK